MDGRGRRLAWSSGTRQQFPIFTGQNQAWKSRTKHVCLHIPITNKASVRICKRSAGLSCHSDSLSYDWLKIDYLWHPILKQSRFVQNEFFKIKIWKNKHKKIFVYIDSSKSRCRWLSSIEKLTSLKMHTNTCLIWLFCRRRMIYFLFPLIILINYFSRFIILSQLPDD